jgi:hypothetical protein
METVSENRSLLCDSRQALVSQLCSVIERRISETVSENPLTSEYRRCLLCGEDWMEGLVETPEWMGEYEDYFQWRDYEPLGRGKGWQLREVAKFGVLQRRGVDGDSDEFRKILGYRQLAESRKVFAHEGYLTARAGSRFVAWLRKGNEPTVVPLSKTERHYLAAVEAEYERVLWEAEEREKWRPKSEPAKGPRRRGRPRKVFGPEGYGALMAAIGITDQTTRRGQQDALYRMRAVHLLGDDYPWLVDKEKMEAGGNAKAWKPIILAELGRIEDERHLRTCARQLCEIRPTSKDAVRRIRKWRVGTKPGDENQFRDELARVINDYRRRHPDFTYAEVRVVLNSLCDEVDELMEE